MERGVVLSPPDGDTPDQRGDHGKRCTTPELYPLTEPVAIGYQRRGRDEQNVICYPRYQSAPYHLTDSRERIRQGHKECGKTPEKKEHIGKDKSKDDTRGQRPFRCGVLGKILRCGHGYPLFFNGESFLCAGILTLAFGTLEYHQLTGTKQHLQLLNFVDLLRRVAKTLACQPGFPLDTIRTAFSLNARIQPPANNKSDNAHH